MKVIILAAGYGTRMGEISKNKPKPLLEINKKPILEHILDKLSILPQIEQYYIISNGKFFYQFRDWHMDFMNNRNGHIHLKVVNDESMSNETRLGAIGDLNFLLNAHPIEDDVLITAGDNLYEFDLKKFYNFFKEKDDDCICALPIQDEAKLKRTGVIQLDENARVIDFEEKPENPKSNLGSPPLYLLKQSTLPLIKTYLEEGNNQDAPGNFIKWLHHYKPVFAYRAEGTRYDVGNLETFKKVNEIYSKKAEKQKLV